MPPMPKVHGPTLPMPKFYGRTLPTPKFDSYHPWTHARTLPMPPVNLCYICHLHYLADSTRIGNGNPKTTILRFVNFFPFNQRLTQKCRELRRANKIQSIFVNICYTMNEGSISIEHERLDIILPKFYLQRKKVKMRRIVVE